MRGAPCMLGALEVKPPGKHGDIAIAKNWPEAHSIPTNVNSTSKAHYMVAVAAPLESLYRRVVLLTPLVADKLVGSLPSGHLWGEKRGWKRLKSLRAVLLSLSLRAQNSAVQC